MAGFQPTYSTNDFNNGSLPSKKLVTGGFLALKVRNFSSKTMVLTDTVSDGTDQPFPIDTINPWTLKHLILDEAPSFVYIQPVPNGPTQVINDPYFTNQRVDYGLDNIVQVYESDLSAGLKGASIVNDLLATNTFVTSITVTLQLTNVQGGQIINFPKAITWPTGWFSGLVALGYSKNNSYSVDPTIYLENSDGTILYPNVQPNCTYTVDTTQNPSNAPSTFDSFPSNTADLAIYVNGSGSLPDDTITLTYFLKMAGVVIENSSAIEVITQGCTLASTDLTSVETTATLITTSQVGSNLVTKLLLTLANNGSVALPSDAVFELFVNGFPWARFCPGAIPPAGTGGPTTATNPYEIDFGDGVVISPNGIAVSCYDWGTAAPMAGASVTYKQ